MERKLATVLFVDLVDSTGLVSASDPEVVRRRVTRFFEQVSRSVTVHGGIVEKFAGDAVLAAFGIPRAHEDDAERAIRAAFAMLESVRELGLEARIGVESGEVVAEDGDSTFATGEAVVLAARLQQAAAPGEILIGPGAHRLTLGRVEVDELGPLDLRGRPEPVWTWRARCPVEREAHEHRQAAPFVGREGELELLENTYARAVRNRRAHLLTIYGEPGVGKSRLAREFVASLEGATVLFGRAMPYGEGITYWPLAEMVKAAAGIADDDPADKAVDKLRECCEDEAVADLLGLAAGVLDAVEGQRSQQEIAWAAREWAEQLAREQPLVLVFEDIHWAEDPLLELIEHLAAWVREAPLLLLCLARPELLDVRPGWGGGRVRHTATELEPLARDESEELVEALLQEPLPGGVRLALLAKTEGNPLYLEETIRMLREDGSDGAVERIPDTLQALIAARIDRLSTGGKTLLQRASVIGRTFWADAVATLSPELDDLEPLLDDLLLREFILDEPRSTITGSRAYRFKHVLIREVAYSGLSKSARADHHAAFAAWLAQRAGEELLEIRAYHLDQAAALLAELDGAPPPELAREAAAALEEAGVRALAREANRSARKLFLRAVELEPTLLRRYRAAKAAWRLADLPAIAAEMERVYADAREEVDAGIQGRALTALSEVALLREGDLPRARDLAEQALVVLAEDDHVARFDTLMTLNQIAWWHGDGGASERWVDRAVAAAQAAGRRDLESQSLDELAHLNLRRGDLEQAEPLVERALELAEESGSIVARGAALSSLGSLRSRRGEIAEAEAALEDARVLFAEAGAAWMLARTLNKLAWLARNKGDLPLAERRFRDSIRILKPLEDRGTLCESQRGLAQLLLELGKVDEAERYALESRETVGAWDHGSRATTRMALGLVRAAQGRDREAEELLREAIEVMDGLDFCNAAPMRALAGFLHARGRGDEAAVYEERLALLPPALREEPAPVVSTAPIA